jgi:membrane-associated protein
MPPILDWILHLDKHLVVLMNDYGVWTYLILFLIVFAETGLVVTPFLPGDSLLFATGALTASGGLDLWTVMGLLFVAAVVGDAVNYAVGHFLGPKVLTENHRFLKREYLRRTEAFYVKYGGKTIVIARFVPIIRTFAPFLAGVGRMAYPRFAAYNVFGAALWVGIFVVGGHFFGNLPAVKRNFTFVILAIIVLSVLPAVVEVWKTRRSGGMGPSDAGPQEGVVGARETEEARSR